MKAPILFGPWDRVYNDDEIPDPNDKVERGGYRTLKQQVDEMKQAGKRLSDYRKGYQYSAEDFGKEEDAVLSPNTDFFDVVDKQRALTDSVNSKIKKAAETPPEQPKPAEESKPE